MISATSLVGRGASTTSGPPHLVGIPIRVSTPRQAANDEGSLKNQLQRTRAYLDMKRACDEDWREVALYELPAVSGSHSLQHAELVRLQQDIAARRVNTVVCTELSRVSRNVAEFLQFVELLNRHECAFICLKQAVDTTTPIGRLMLTFLAALAQFEREMTAERTRDAMAARSGRGLWNGGRLYGYAADPERKGYLSVIDLEADVIQFAFVTYLACGSIAKTVEALNVAGHRTRAFTSGTKVEHAGGPFRISNVQYLLKNPAYIGMKDLKKAKTKPGPDDAVGDQLVPAVWEPIVDREVFDEVQRLIAANATSRTNQAKQYPHVYVLSSGILICGECGSPMEGRSGSGHLGVKYHYYVDRNKACQVRVSATEIEGIVLDRLQILATSDGILDKLVAATNTRLQDQLPALQKRKRALGRDLADIEGQLDRLLSELSSFTGTGRSVIATKLDELGERRHGIESAITDVDEALRHIQTSALTAEPIREALARITEIYEQLKPIEKKELVRLLIRKATVSDRRMTLEVRGDALSDGEMLRPGAERFETPDRLPESMSQSVVLYEFPVRLRGLRVAKRLREQRSGAAGSLVCSI